MGEYAVQSLCRCHSVAGSEPKMPFFNNCNVSTMNKTITVISFLYCMFPALLQAQTGTLQGMVADEESKEMIIGATIYIAELSQGAASEFVGRYIIRNIPSGRDDVVVSYVGYQSRTITGVEIQPDERTSLDYVLSMGAAELDAISVIAFRDASTISSVVLDVQHSSQVASGVSRQQIALSQDGNAAQVRQRVPGITIDRKSTRLNSSHVAISYAVFCLKKKDSFTAR